MSDKNKGALVVFSKETHTHMGKQQVTMGKQAGRQAGGGRGWVTKGGHNTHKTWQCINPIDQSMDRVQETTYVLLLATNFFSVLKESKEEE